MIIYQVFQDGERYINETGYPTPVRSEAKVFRNYESAKKYKDTMIVGGNAWRVRPV